MPTPDVDTFERIRDALMPYGIETSILDRKGYSMSLRFTKPGSSGQRTLHVNCRKVGGDVRLRHNQVADAKRLCREAG